MPFARPPMTAEIAALSEIRTTAKMTAAMVSNPMSATAYHKNHVLKLQSA
jgi:hypothetical protein